MQGIALTLAPLAGGGGGAPRAVSLVAAYAVATIHAASGVVAFSTASVLSNRVVPRAQRAQVNGAAATIEAVGKMTGPALGASVFATSVRAWGRAGHGIAFWLLAALCGVMFSLGASRLPVSLDHDDAMIAVANADDGEAASDADGDAAASEAERGGAEFAGGGGVAKPPKEGSGRDGSSAQQELVLLRPPRCASPIAGPELATVDLQ